MKTDTFNIFNTEPVTNHHVFSTSRNQETQKLSVSKVNQKKPLLETHKSAGSSPVSQLQKKKRKPIRSRNKVKRNLNNKNRS